MSKVKVTINGVDYPCRPTMGAMLRFKKETGKEVTDCKDGNFSDTCTYLYCCVASACAADKIPFNYTLMEFADALTPDDMTAWAKAMQPEDGLADDDEKKS